MNFIKLLFVLSLALISCAGHKHPPELGNYIPPHIYPPIVDAGPDSSEIIYHDGPILLGTINIYIIWYGDWSQKVNTQNILIDFINHLGGSNYFDINSTYYTWLTNDEIYLGGLYVYKAYINGSLNYIGDVFDNYSAGSVINNSNNFTVVTNAFEKKLLPVDGNAVYLVLTSEDVDLLAWGALCKDYCGWHNYRTYRGTSIKYAYIGDLSKCPNNCVVSNRGMTANSDISADGMVSVIAHELDESVTDPELNAWYDESGNENADKCAWTFGQTYEVNGATANVKLGDRDYLIQQNWINIDAGYCSLQYQNN